MLNPWISHLYPPQHNIKYGFFGRSGGVSQGLYKGLNCGKGSKDNPQHIDKNKTLVCQYFGDGNLVTLYQHHSNIVVDLDEHPQTKTDIKADAMVTTDIHLILGILTADCGPILLYEPNRNCIAAIHAGWRGSHNGIIQNTINLMRKKGCKVQDIIALIGPLIHQENYQVGEDYRTTIISTSPVSQRWFRIINNSWHFDLRHFIEQQLRDCGIQQLDHIMVDTYASDNCYSYRRATHKQEDDYGRQISAIMLSQ